jgi:PPOX class probable F420-dependent enzyme
VRAEEALEPFVGKKTVLLTTFRRNGTPIGTPVSIAVDGDRAFIRTYDRAWKTKRMRNNPEVEIAPSTLRGKPTGSAIRARARLLGAEESEHAARAIARNNRLLQGVLVPLGHRLLRYRTMHFELRPIDGLPNERP